MNETAKKRKDGVSENQGGKGEEKSIPRNNSGQSLHKILRERRAAGSPREERGRDTTRGRRAQKDREREQLSQQEHVAMAAVSAATAAVALLAMLLGVTGYTKTMWVVLLLSVVSVVRWGPAFAARWGLAPGLLSHSTREARTTHSRRLSRE